MSNLEQIFNEVKKIDWLKATVSFYIVKRKLKKREGRYTIFNVNLHEFLETKISKTVTDIIKKSNMALEYEFTTSDLDNNLLGIPTKDTDLKKLVDEIIKDEGIQLVNSYKLLQNSWIYIARLDIEGNTLYSIRKISDGWNTKKKISIDNAIFQNSMLMKIDAEEVFRIDNKVDFFSFKDFIFIADKKNFETALNFRTGMEKNKEEIIEEFRIAKLFVNVDEISNLVGDNIPRLRKLSQVKKSNYYSNPDFLRQLRNANETENWGLVFEDGQLTINEGNIDTILTILNNSRLKSPINEESFDVDVKRKLD